MESGFDFKHLIGRRGGNVLRCVWASLPGDVSRLWEAGSPARTVWRGLGSSVSPLRVTFLSRLQQLVRSPAVPDYESPLGPPWLSVKGEHSTAEWCSILPRPATQTSIRLPHCPSWGAPGSTCSWVLSTSCGVGHLTPSLDLARMIYRVTPGYKANPTLPAGSAV